MKFRKYESDIVVIGFPFMYLRSCNPTLLSENLLSSSL